MDKLLQKSTKPKSKFLDNTRSDKKGLIVGSLIATFIAISPYLFTLWEGVPDQKVWHTFLFTYKTTYYTDIQTLVWTLLNQLIPLILLILWMFTCRHWWYHALLVPIGMYTFEIITILNDDLKFSGGNLLFYLLPVMAIVIPSIYLIRAKMFNKLIERNQTLEDLEEEFKIKPKGILQKFGDYF